MRRRTRKSVRWRENDAEEISRPDDEVSQNLSEGYFVPVVSQPDAVSAAFRESRPAFPRHVFGRFHAAFFISVLFHLSMVVVFNVVIYFPRDDIQYYKVEIVQARPAALLPVSSPDRLRLSKAQDPFEKEVRPADQLSGLDGMLDIELPTLEFAELSRLKVRQENVNPPIDYSEFFLESPKDSWAQFHAGIKKLRQTISELAFPSPTDAAPAKAEPAPEIVTTFRPAQGFNAHIEWSSEPKNRKLLFSPPMEALWSVDPASVKKGIEFVLTVDANGRVVNAWNPVIDPSGLMDSLQMTALKYRFEPLAVGKSGEQVGTLYIQSAGDQP